MIIRGTASARATEPEPRLEVNETKKALRFPDHEELQFAEQASTGKIASHLHRLSCADP
jgi:hypothetical protein